MTVRSLFKKMVSSTFMLLLVPVIVSAQNMEWIDTLRTELVRFFNVAVPVLIALAFLFFVWGGIVFISHSADDTQRAEGRKRMVWGVVALFILVTIWGIVQLIQAIVGIPINDSVQDNIKAPKATVK